MTALLIIGSIFLLILLILFSPVKVFLGFENDFFAKVKFLGFKVYETPQKTGKKKVSEAKNKQSGKKAEKENNTALKEGKQLLLILKEKYGFTGAVKKVLNLIYGMLTHIKKFLRHIRIKKIKLNLVVSGSDAAETAVEYGKVCAAVYPVLGFLDSFSSIELKRINISSDFAENKKEFEFSMVIKLQIFYMLVTAFNVYKDYKNFTIKENYNERK